jgi:hypothetical protein
MPEMLNLYLSKKVLSLKPIKVTTTVAAIITSVAKSIFCIGVFVVN